MSEKPAPKKKKESRTPTVSKPLKPKKEKSGRGPGRPPGTPNRKTLLAKERLLELGCDPEEFLALVMTGKEPSLAPNPVLVFLREIHNDLPKGDGPPRDVWDKIMEICERELGYGEATLDQRIKIAIDLMGYCRPKLKSVEFQGKLETPDLASLAAGARELLAAKLDQGVKTIEVASEELERG